MRAAHHHGARAPGLVAPEPTGNDEARWQAGFIGDQGKEQNDGDCPPDGPSSAMKRLSTLRAQLALRGIALIDMSDGGFLAGQWGLSVGLADLDAVHAFARRVGAIR